MVLNIAIWEVSHGVTYKLGCPFLSQLRLILLIVVGKVDDCPNSIVLDIVIIGEGPHGTTHKLLAQLLLVFLVGGKVTDGPNSMMLDIMIREEGQHGTTHKPTCSFLAQ